MKHRQVLSFPYTLILQEKKDRKRILNTLLTNIANHKNHLATGFVGTPYICHTLSENGAHEMAATLFMKEDYPSWLYAVNMEQQQSGSVGIQSNQTEHLMNQE